MKSAALASTICRKNGTEECHRPMKFLMGASWIIPAVALFDMFRCKVEDFHEVS
jgi:hypothetical protein